MKSPKNEKTTAKKGVANGATLNALTPAPSRSKKFVDDDDEDEFDVPMDDFGGIDDFTKFDDDDDDF